MSQRTEELIQLALDNATSGAEADELASRLENDPEARRTDSEFHQVVETLENTPPVEPSPTLRNRIMEAVHSSVPRAATKFPVAPGLIRRVEFLKLAAALSLGVLLGVLFSSQSSDAGLDQNHLAGTMSAPREAIPSAVEYSDAIPFSGGTISGEIRTIGSDHGITLDLTFTSEDHRDVIISFDSSYARFRGMERDDESTTELVTSPGLLTLKSVGPHRIALDFETDDRAALEVTVQQNGQTVFGVSVVGETRF